VSYARRAHPRRSNGGEWGLAQGGIPGTAKVLGLVLFYQVARDFFGYFVDFAVDSRRDGLERYVEFQSIFCFKKLPPTQKKKNLELDSNMR
jgi:hypothetical protein